VRRAILDNRPAIEKLGKELASQWGLADLNQWNGPKISTLKKEDVLKQVVEAQGDSKRGEQVFGLLGCAKCHDVKPNEVLRGPYLPNVAKTYKRDQLTEAILMPSKSIAQGFVQNVFRLDDDRVVSGFVTKESPEKVVLRNAQGEVVEIQVESISERKESPVSVMPEGLADGMPITALADLISYLESLN
jgi:putative heme-binding domain-containing protein